MKLFEVFERKIAIFIARDPHHSNTLTNQILFFFFVGLCVLSTSAFLVFEAETFQDLPECVYIWFSAVIIFFALVIANLIRGDIFHVIDSFRSLVAKRK